jgi:hypothetical protein
MQEQGRDMAGKQLYTDEFEVFWRYYPKRWDRNRQKLIKRKKFPAFESWQKLESDTHHEILTKVKFIKDFEGGSARDPVTWLNQRGWDDIEFKVGYIPVLPKELLESALKRTVFEPVDSNQSRTDNLKKLRKP